MARFLNTLVIAGVVLAGVSSASAVQDERSTAAAPSRAGFRDHVCSVPGRQLLARRRVAAADPSAQRGLALKHVDWTGSAP